MIEKLPMFALVMVSIVLTIWAQNKGGAIKSLDEMPLLVRFSNVTTAYFMYIKLMLWPTNLACLYPYPITPASSDGARTLFLIWGAVAAVGLAAISAACVMLRRRWPYLAFGWFWYLGTLVPVIGLLQVGLSSMADRYTYVPFIGLFVALTWWVSDVLPVRREGRPYLAAVATLIVIACLALTWRQVGYWRDTDTLLGHALAVTENNFYLDRQWAVVLRKRGRIEDALVYYRRASQTRPDLATQHSEYGTILTDLRQINKHRKSQGLEYDPKWLRASVLTEAQQEFERALEIVPGESTVLGNLGVVYDEQGRHEDAMRMLRESIQSNPANSESQYNLAQMLIREQRYRESIPHFQAAVATKPELLDRRRQFISVLAYLVHHRQATPQERAWLIAELQTIVALDPNDQAALKKLQEMQGR